jgi:hypothetical protein
MNARGVIQVIVATVGPRLSMTRIEGTARRRPVF